MSNPLKELLINLPLIKGFVTSRRKNLKRKESERKVKEDENWNSLFKPGSEALVFDMDNGTKINLFRDSILSRFIFRGDFEKKELEFLKSKLKTGDIFIDIGANIGLFSMIASELVGKQGRIIAFEPSPSTYHRLLGNIELNEFINIEARNIGLSDSAGSLQLKVSGNGHDAWNTFAEDLTGKFNQTVSVPVHTLDEQLNDVDKSQISLIKIDVEGWEKFVLMGAREFLNTHSPALMIELTQANSEAAGYNVHEIYDLLVSWGYSWYRFKDGHLLKEKRKERYPDDNLIAIKHAG